ncbi:MULTISPECIES: hypothetical protein [Rubritalea]|nr:hypothetical protein [Rubritalea squalenifaciens]
MAVKRKRKVRKDMVNYRIGKLARKAFHAAYEGALQSGQPVLAVRDQNVLYKINSDGSEEVLKHLPELVEVSKLARQYSL